MVVYSTDAHLHRRSEETAASYSIYVLFKIATSRDAKCKWRDEQVKLQGQFHLQMISYVISNIPLQTYSQPTTLIAVPESTAIKRDGWIMVMFKYNPYYRIISLAHLLHSWLPHQPLERHLVVTFVYYWPSGGINLAGVMPMIALHIY